MKQFIVQMVAMTIALVSADTLKDAEQIALARAENLKKVNWCVNDSQVREDGEEFSFEDDDCEDDDDDCDEFGFDDDDCDEFGFDDDDCEDEDEDDCEDDNDCEDEDDQE